MTRTAQDVGRIRRHSPRLEKVTIFYPLIQSDGVQKFDYSKSLMLAFSQ